MIESFMNAWDTRKGEIEAKLCLEHPECFSDLVKMVVEILSETGERVCRGTGLLNFEQWKAISALFRENGIAI